MPLLEIKNITYRVKEKEIFSGLSLAVDPGEVIAQLNKAPDLKELAGMQDIQKASGLCLCVWGVVR